MCLSVQPLYVNTHFSVIWYINENRWAEKCIEKKKNEGDTTVRCSMSVYTSIVLLMSKSIVAQIFDMQNNKERKKNFQRAKGGKTEHINIPCMKWLSAGQQTLSTGYIFSDQFVSWQQNGNVQRNKIGLTASYWLYYYYQWTIQEY